MNIHLLIKNNHIDRRQDDLSRRAGTSISPQRRNDEDKKDFLYPVCFVRASAYRLQLCAGS